MSFVDLNSEQKYKKIFDFLDGAEEMMNLYMDMENNGYSELTVSYVKVDEELHTLKRESEIRIADYEGLVQKDSAELEETILKIADKEAAIEQDEQSVIAATANRDATNAAFLATLENLNSVVEACDEAYAILETISLPTSSFIQIQSQVLNVKKKMENGLKFLKNKKADYMLLIATFSKITQDEKPTSKYLKVVLDLITSYKEDLLLQIEDAMKTEEISVKNYNDFMASTAAKIEEEKTDLLRYNTRKTELENQIETNTGLIESEKYNVESIIAQIEEKLK